MDETISMMVDEQTPVGVPERFAVADEGSANWVVRRIVEVRLYKDRVEEWAQQETARADREEAFFLSRFGGELEAWLRRRLAETKSRQRSINLPAGRVGLRATSMKLIVEDEEAAIAWAKEHCPAAVTTVTAVKLSKTALTQYVEKTGEFPARVVLLEPPTDRLIIR